MFPPILVAFAGTSADAPTPTLPIWMAGCWQTEADRGLTEECWSEPLDKSMIGYSRTVTGGQLTSWEVMQFQLEVEAANDRKAVGMRFWAAPQGRKWTMFAWRLSELPGITAYNVANDYPQRIRYWREGEMLMAETALADGRKARRWRYRKAGR